MHLAEADIAATLGRLGLTRQQFYVFAPGAEYGPAKRWPARHFAELAARLDKPVVLLGSAKEAALCEKLATIARQAVSGRDAGPGRADAVPALLNLAGKTMLAEAFALIAASEAVVTNDSGLMHVAAAFGVRQVAIFGSSSPLHTPPLNERAAVIWLKDDPRYQPPLDCASCFEREFPLGHTRCLNDIGADQALLKL